MVLPVLSFAIIGVAVAIVAEGGLAFLGSVRRPADRHLGRHDQRGPHRRSRPMPQIALIPSFVMFLTVLTLNFVGDRVREYFDVKEGGL